MKSLAFGLSTSFLVAQSGLGAQATAAHARFNEVLRIDATPTGSFHFLQSNSSGEPARHVGLNLKCGETNKAGAHTNKYEDCPADCPYFAQNREDAEHCTFVCVPGDECGDWNPNKPIADNFKGSKTCRGPRVQFCSETALDGSDRCRRCQRGWKLWEEDGKCYFDHFRKIIAGLIVFAVLVAVVIVWIVDWCCRETINPEGVLKGETHRARAKIHKPRHLFGPGEARTVWPLNTNLTREDIAGPGMLLHFRFQVAFLIWPLFVAMLWTVMACFHNELFVLGTRKFGTPRNNCIMVAWGYETQQRLMWTKVFFLAVVYVVSFIYFLLFSVSQHRKYQELDAKEKTMKDFALYITGLPEISGDEKLEVEIKEELERSGFKDIVGVSVCWNYGEEEDTIMSAVRADLIEREIEMKEYVPPDARLEIDRLEERREQTSKKFCGSIRNKFYDFETYLCGPSDEDEAMTMQDMLRDFKCSDTAFVVFNTEERKQEALRIAEERAITFRRCKLEAHDVECEPLTVNWQNFGRPSWWTFPYRFAKGFFGVYLPALSVWFFLFYLPYAWSLYNFNYNNGAELPGYYGLIFTIVVVGGNATMYVVCDICGDIIGYKYKDSKQVTYMLMYLVACMINVLLDMAVTWMVAQSQAIGYDFRTYHGKRLQDIDSFTDLFETYAMQRSLAENVFVYSFPSTFLIPFLLEPIITVLVPYQLGKLIVRTHREIQGACAEAYFAAFEFDLGRYADILLNVFLGILIFWFPGGYTWTLFFGMFISHIVIYAFDHWRVLDVIPTVKIVSKSVDWWAQVVIAGCCGMILSALVFKANCESYSGFCVKDFKLIELCTLAGLAHFSVHTMLIIVLVPMLGKDLEDDNASQVYSAAAEDEPFSWFSTNPVHCLRSKYIYREKIYCRYACVGKEHLLQKNPKIACYFEDIPAASEEFDTSKLAAHHASSFKNGVRRFSSRGRV
jgi:hypothetical protein